MAVEVVQADFSTRYLIDVAKQYLPDGHVIVPHEPTEAMLAAARDWSAAKYGKPIGNDAAGGCWAAMLAAAVATTS